MSQGSSNVSLVIPLEPSSPSSESPSGPPETVLKRPDLSLPVADPTLIWRGFLLFGLDLALMLLDPHLQAFPLPPVSSLPHDPGRFLTDHKCSVNAGQGSCTRPVACRWTPKPSVAVWRRLLPGVAGPYLNIRTSERVLSFAGPSPSGDGSYTGGGRRLLEQPNDRTAEPPNAPPELIRSRNGSPPGPRGRRTPAGQRQSGPARRAGRWSSIR